MGDFVQNLYLLFYIFLLIDHMQHMTTCALLATLEVVLKKVNLGRAAVNMKCLS